MWIYSTVGHFSIVNKPHEAAPGRPFQVRARNAEDLADLIAVAGLKGAKVIKTPEADYAARIAVTAEQLGDVMSALATCITYPNFKDAIAKTRAQADKLDMLHDIWAVGRDYQIAKARGKRW